MFNFLRPKPVPDPTAERLRIAEELLAKVRRAADRKNAPVTEIRSILEAGRVKMRLVEAKRGRVV